MHSSLQCNWFIYGLKPAYFDVSVPVIGSLLIFPHSASGYSAFQPPSPSTCWKSRVWFLRVRGRRTSTSSTTCLQDLTQNSSGTTYSTDQRTIGSNHFIFTLQNFAKYITHPVCLLTCSQHISKTTARMIITFLGSIRSVTRKYCFHPWCPDGRAGGGKKFVRVVSKKP